jgi:hypothetical protein
MFGIDRLTLFAFGGLTLALLATAGAAWYFKSEYAAALEDKGKLEVALTVQQGATESALSAVDAWKSSAEGFQKALSEMTKAQFKAAEETRRLNDIFSEHDLGALARKKPKLVEGRVNLGSDRMRGMLEDAARGRNSVGSGEAGRDAGAAAP